MSKNLQVWLGIIVSVFVILGGLWKYDQYKADASEVVLIKSEIQLVAMRLDQKIINDNIRAIQQRIWDIQMYYQKMGQPIPPEVQQQIQRMEYDIQMLKEKLKRG